MPYACDDNNTKEWLEVQGGQVTKTCRHYLLIDQTCSFGVVTVVCKRLQNIRVEV